MNIDNTNSELNGTFGSFDKKTISIDGPLDRQWVVSLLAEGYTTYDIIKNYELSEELILECQDLLDKNVIFEGITMSEDFVRKAIDCEYFNTDDITNLNMNTYINLTSKFIEEFGKYINWNRMIIYLSTQTNSFYKYVEVIDSNNLWSLISANDLDINFIREYKDKLDWKLLSMTKCFTEEQKEEFSEYILYQEKKEFVSSQESDFVSEMSDEQLEELIEKLRMAEVEQMNRQLSRSRDL